MTYGPNSRIIGSSPSALFSNRNIIVNPIPGNGGVVLGGFSDDYTAMGGGVQLNGPATFYAAQSGRVDFTGPISGSGAVQIGASSPVYVEGAGTTGIQLGPNGTIAFTVANSYSGGTTVASGRFLVNGSLYASSSSSATSTVTVSAGTLGGTGTIYGPVTVGPNTMLEAGMAAGSPLTLANGLTAPYNYFTGSNVIFQFDSLGAAGNPGLVVDNGLNNVGLTGPSANTQEILITGAISGTGAYALIATDSNGTASLAAGITNGTFVLNPLLPNRAVGSLQINPSNPEELDLAVNQIYSVAWTGLHGGDWNTLGNFVQMGGSDNYGKFQPGDAVVFSDSAANTNLTLNSGNVAPSSMTFQNQTSIYTISGTASITGNTGLSLTNGGTLVIKNTNTFTGLTSIGPGATLQLGSAGAGPDGYLPYTTISDSGSLVYSLTGQQTFANPITGPGVLQLNSGAVTLTSTGNTFSGGTTISGGTLQVGDGLTTNGSLLGQVTDNSLLVFANYASQTFGGTISGSGAVTKSGQGLLTLLTANSYSGGTTISGGTLVLGNGQPGQDASLAGAVADNSVFAFNYASNETFAGAIGGNGALVTLGSRMLTLINNETYSGLTTISAGTLVLGNGITSGAVAGNILNNSSLIFNNPVAQSYTGNIRGNGGLVMLGAGPLALSGSNTYTGGTLLDSGTLNFTSSALPAGSNSITFNGGVLQWAAGNTLDVSAGFAPIAASQLANIDTNGNNVTFASPLSGQGGLTKYGAGILTLTASNGYTGGTTVDAGTLLAANTAALPGYTAPGSIVVNAGATLAVTAGTKAGEFSLTSGGGVDSVLLGGSVYFAAGANLGINVNSPENVTYGTSIANTTNGPLGFVKLGAGLLSLTGNNTYTGGTQVNGGVLIATSVSTLGSFGGQPAYLAGGQISVNNTGSTLVVQAGTGTGEFQPSDVSSVLSNVTFGTGTVFGIQVVSGESFSYASSIPDGTSGTAGMGFLKMGNGTLTLAAQNNYSGPTTISSGVLVAAAAGALGNGTAIQVGDANTGSGAPSTLVCVLISGLNTFSQNITVNAASATLGNLTDDNAGFGGTITLNSSLTISSQSVSPGNSLTFSGNIVHGSGTNSVTLSGPGNVVFLGAATYQGATTINGGYLTVGATVRCPPRPP